MILMIKLRGMYGFSKVLIKLLVSYLTNRKQFIEIEGFRSVSFTPTSGVPQGSNLGPLLFLLFINDLLNILDCYKLAYADDLKIFCNITTLKDCSLLQHNINLVSEWCDLNRLSLNVSKCFIMSYYTNKNPIEFDYQINEISLIKKSQISDLGIMFDREFTFVPHVENVTSRASKMLGFVLRNCKLFINPSVIKTLFCSFVRSRLRVWLFNLESPLYLPCKHSGGCSEAFF